MIKNIWETPIKKHKNWDRATFEQVKSLNSASVDCLNQTKGRKTNFCFGQDRETAKNLLCWIYVNKGLGGEYGGRVDTSPGQGR